jgi:hypothetical protein
MLRINRQIVAAVLLAVGVTVGGPFLAAEDPEKAQEALRAAEAQLKAAEAQVQLARANYEQAKQVRLAQQEVVLRQRFQSVEWVLQAVRPAGDTVTLRLNHHQRLFLTDLPVARDVRVSIDNAPGKLANLKVGMRLGLRLAADDLVVTGIDAVTPEALADCLVKEVDVANQTITVTRSGKDFLSALYVGNADVSINDEEAGLKDLKPGMRVSLSFGANGGRLSVQEINARK